MRGLTMRQAALLRALLSDARLTGGFGCLRPGDFMLERHRSVYAASWQEADLGCPSLGRREAVELAAVPGHPRDTPGNCGRPARTRSTPA